MALTGAAADLARRTGVQGLAVSLTHEAGLASAVVVGTTVKDSATLTDTE
jgi:phosphopantetheinyl transferase (holo-ACP synthase)